MNISRLVTLWPCHSIEDFPAHYKGDDAREILVGWTMLWHPSLIAFTKRLPEWCRYDRVEDLEGALLTLPTPTRRRMEPEALDRVRKQEWLVEDFPNRRRLLQELLPKLGIEGLVSDPSAAEQTDRMVDSFFSLGYAWLQIQLMTRQLRYSSSLDEASWSSTVLEAAQQVVSHEHAAAREAITRAFDLLAEEKNRFYPVSASLVDLTLLTAGLESVLPAQLEQAHPQNWLVSGNDLDRLAKAAPTCLPQIKAKVDAEQLEWIGGEQGDFPSQAKSLQNALEGFQSGLATFERLTGRRPQVYGRRTPGLNALLPDFLSKLGFRGALHLPFAGEKLPMSSAPVFTWQSANGSQIPAVGGVLLDASRADSFLKLGIQIGEQIDSYHNATIVLAHWPDQYSEFFHDFQLANFHGGLLGRFRLLGEVFDDYYDSGYGDAFDVDDYRVGILGRWVAEETADPISSLIRDTSLHEALQVVERLVGLLEILTGSSQPERFQVDAFRRILAIGEPADLTADRPTLQAIVALQTNLQHLIETSLSAAAGSTSSSTETSAKADQQDAYFAINPTNQAARIALRAPHNGTVDVESEIRCFVDVPALSAAWGSLPPTPPGGASRMIDGNGLRNEYLNVVIDPQTGGIRSVKTHVARSQNILSQQLALRVPIVSAKPNGKKETDQESASLWTAGQKAPDNRYSEMRAESVNFTSVGTTAAKAISEGQLWHGGQPVARFRQCVKLVRGSCDLMLSVDLEPYSALTGQPWQHYFCSRLAWHDEGARRHREVLGMLLPCYLERFHAPSRIRIDDGRQPFSLLPEGLPFHQQSTLRMLDTLLIVRGESARSFGFTIRIEPPDAPPPLLNERDSASGTTWFPIKSHQVETGVRQARLLKITPTRLKVISLRPLLNDQGQPCGVAMTLLEPDNRAGPFQIVGPRDWISAQQVDLLGQFQQDLEVDSGIAKGTVHGLQLLCLQLKW